jgi:hypothetical protein
MVLEKLEIHIYIETISKSLVDQYIEIKPENVKLPKERIGNLWNLKAQAVTS